MEKKSYISHSEEETIELGEKFAKLLKPGYLVALYGELGSGKTEFIKGICNYFGVNDIVTSPTFTIMNTYFPEDNSEVSRILHLDLYRIKDVPELEEIGFADVVYDESSIKLIEWAEKADSILNGKCNFSVRISQTDEDENKRFIEISSK